jgi:hypothetical protein
MSQSHFDWPHFGKCLAISAAAGLGIPVLWEIIKFFALFFGVFGQFVILIAGALSLYVLCFPWYLILGFSLVTAHWAYFSFATALLLGLIWGTVTARNRPILPPPSSPITKHYPFN